VGGKRAFVRTNPTLFPTNFDRYYEPFAGGLSVFFHLTKLSEGPIKATIGDLNQSLIATYEAVQTNWKLVADESERMVERFPKPQKELIHLANSARTRNLTKRQSEQFIKLNASLRERQDRIYRQMRAVSSELHLDDEQIKKLIVHLKDYLESWKPRSPMPGEIEEGFTATVVLPFIKHLVRDIGRKTLLVNGDGGTQPNHIYRFGTSFRPDLEIVEGFKRYIAFEVKLISDIDPSGSISKAFGQSVVYSQFSHRFAFCLLFDYRFSKEVLSLTSVDSLGDCATALMYAGSSHRNNS
jgi:hypothetical protein